MKIYRKKQILIILAILLCSISFVIVFGRYVTNSINNFFIRSKEFYFFSDKMVNIDDVYVNIYDEKNPFIHQERFAKIIDKEYDENGNLWVKYEYFVKKADADMYDTHIYHDKYRDFLETHRLEKLNK